MPVDNQDQHPHRRVFGPQEIANRDGLVESCALLPTGGVMPTAKTVQSATISAPPKKVYEFLSEPTRATSFIPGLSRIHDVKPATTQPGQTWSYEFDWFGFVVSGNSRCTRSEDPKVYEFQTITGNPSTWTYQIEPDGSNTRLTLAVQYEVPGNVVARFASQPVFEKMNQDRAVEVVANIKAMLEG
jgi:carbon monoxide dehydrogenase subunit G